MNKTYTQIELRDNRSEKVNYNSKEFQSYVKKGFLSSYPNYRAVSHWHNDLEFILILKGQMQYNINGKVVLLEEGNGIFVNSRQLHYGFSDSKLECEFICILLHPVLLCPTQFLEEKYVLPVTQNEGFSFCVLHKNVEWESNVLSILKKIYSVSKKDFYELKIQILFYNMWIELYKNAPKSIETKSSHNLDALKNMIGFIQEHFKEKLLLDDIAEAGKVCKSRSCSIFQNYLNQTPVQFITGYRLKKSIELLKNSDKTVTEISYETGFQGASYYAESFKKNLGCSPSEYRKRFSAKDL